MQTEVCRLSVCWWRNKQKLSICKRTKRTCAHPWNYLYISQDFWYWFFGFSKLQGKLLCIDGHNRRWIDTDAIDRYYWSCWPLIVSIHQLKIFSLWSIVSIIDHKILIRTMTIHPSVHIQPMVSIHWSKIGSPAHFSKWRKARKYSPIIGHGKYDGLKGLCQKICCSKTVKMKKAEVYSSIKSCTEYEV